jgi:dipeptidyl aminopeptidase B
MPAHERLVDAEEVVPLTRNNVEDSPSSRESIDSISSASTRSIILEEINARGMEGSNRRSKAYPNNWDRRNRNDVLDDDPLAEQESKPEAEDDVDEEGQFLHSRQQLPNKRLGRLVYILAAIFIGAWVLALISYIFRETYKSSNTPVKHDPHATETTRQGKPITLDSVMQRIFSPRTHGISWIEGPNGEDGMVLEEGENAGGYLVVEDVRKRSSNESMKAKAKGNYVLMKDRGFKWGDEQVYPNEVWPSKNLKGVLAVNDKQSNWRHSFTGHYWIFNVEKQEGEPLDPENRDDRVQLASWSPQSDAVVFTRNNNMYLRKLDSPTVQTITKDGGTELFYGVPDWVYEEEVFAGSSATWWSDDGKYIAFLRTNETAVPEFPLQYWIDRPSGKEPEPGLESYPETQKIKYPKSGAPNPTVDLQFYDVEKSEVFSVAIDGEFPDDDRLITEVVWAGSTGKVLVKMTNRESDILKVVLIDTVARVGMVVRTVDVNKIDGGWFEISQDTTYIPADPKNGRPKDGYIDTIIHEGYDHLGYFTPMDNPDPIILTSGKWEVVAAPSAVDLKKNLVYFVSTKESPIERHVYSVKLDGTELKPITKTDKASYAMSFSKGAGYGLLSYNGPDIPYQKIISTEGAPEPYEDIIEKNEGLSELASQYEFPIKIYSTVTVDGFKLQVVERRPPHFDPRKKYPVLFYLYGGPGSQTVSRGWSVDFQAYVASSLGYIVVTVDGRGTGFIGREARTSIRKNIGYYEAYDQIETAKIWSKKNYVDETRLCIWGWSYGGFMTLKVLEQDAGQTFSYGMAVAPVTDWRFYDSIYTERYLLTPQHNPSGYANASISNMTALSQNVRFLFMHGVADDNVHTQNSFTLLDKLDVAGVENYDFHAFPDSDHSIYFHNANRMVFDSEFPSPVSSHRQTGKS